MQSTRYCCQMLIKLEFSRKAVENYSNIKFHENPSSGSRVVQGGRTDGRTDMTKLAILRRRLETEPKYISDCR
jgi:hypothetical protein